MEIKIGDRVKCIPGFHTWTENRLEYEYGGYGYEEGLVFIVEGIDKLPVGKVLWGKTAFHGGGVYDKAVVKLEEFTPFPIVKKHYFLDSLK